MLKITKIILIIPLICLINLNTVIACYNTSYNISNTVQSEKYKISINGAGGRFEMENVIIDGKQVLLPSPNRKGYEFIGFSSLNSGSVEYTNYIENVEKINNKKIYAKWDIIDYKIVYNLNGGTISNQPTSYNIEDSFTLPIPEKKGYIFMGWTGTELSSITKDVTILKGSTGDRNYTANWQAIEFTVDVNSIIQEKTYSSGLEGYTFSVWIDKIQVANKVKDYYNKKVPYGAKVRVCVYDREGYSITSFKDKTWTITNNLTITPKWYDDIPPTITSFKVENLGLYNPNAGTSEGWNIRVTINAYDKGSGIKKYQMWIKPYGNGSGSAIHETSSRIFTNVLYLETKNGRTFCATVIDNAGNKTEKSDTIRVDY